MLMGSQSEYFLKQTRSKAKMYEYNIPNEIHIAIEKNNIDDLMLMAIGLLGDISTAIITNDNQKILGLKQQLRFSCQYFDAYYKSQLYDGTNEYLKLMASASYYFSEYYGSSIVLAKRINLHEFDLGANGLEKTLLWLLKHQFNVIDSGNEELNVIISMICKYYLKAEKVDINYINKIRKNIYSSGSARELLLIDILFALLIMKIKNSSLKLLPEYTNISIDNWKQYVLKPNFIKELWPSQRILGEQGIYNGKSAVVQLPTSAGKTKAISLIIQSSFLERRTNSVIIVAPFRALCKEISIDLQKDFSDNADIVINEISDHIEFSNDLVDFFQQKIIDQKSIIVVTPEKLIYMLRQDAQFMESIGLIIFDEGHLFDDETRGTVYELLISTIISYTTEVNIQKILISAVISNANDINSWLNGDNGVIISNTGVQSTEKSVAFFDWDRSRYGTYGYLYFIDPNDINNEEYYVPRVISIKQLQRLPKEKKDRYFPDVNFKKGLTNSGDVAIYLAEKLCNNGGVAIFCGIKDSAIKILNRFIELEMREYNLSHILKNCDYAEVESLKRLIIENYGADNEYYKCAKLGIFAHHANISNGIRIATEYAMRQQKIKIIICTSTLAQGVNLPIKYLLVSSMYQAGEKIKVRDFHNLIGRTGRAGFYTRLLSKLGKI